MSTDSTTAATADVATDEKPADSSATKLEQTESLREFLAGIEGQQILPLMAEAKRRIGSIGKDRDNTQFHYKFRGVDDVLNVCGPVFSSLGLVTVPRYTIISASERKTPLKGGGERIDITVRVSLDLRFYAPDGSTLPEPITTIGEGMDYGSDKASNKAMAAAFKYALFLGLTIPVDPGSIDDSDAAPAPPDVERNRNAQAATGRPQNRARTQGSGRGQGQTFPPAGGKQNSGQKPQGQAGQGKGKPAEGKKPEGDRDKISAALKSCGCETVDQAAAVVSFCTDGDVRDPKEYREDPAVAKIVLEEVNRTIKHFGTARILEMSLETWQREAEAAKKLADQTQATGEPAAAEVEAGHENGK